MRYEILGSRVEGGKLIVETADGVEEYDSQFLVAIILLYIARGSGQIEAEESAKIIDLIVEKFQMKSSDALELITRAMAVRAQNRNSDRYLWTWRELYLILKRRTSR